MVPHPGQTLIPNHQQMSRRCPWDPSVRGGLSIHCPAKGPGQQRPGEATVVVWGLEQAHKEMLRDLGSSSLEQRRVQVGIWLLCSNGVAEKTEPGSPWRMHIPLQ